MKFRRSPFTRSPRFYSLPLPDTGEATTEQDDKPSYQESDLDDLFLGSLPDHKIQILNSDSDDENIDADTSFVASTSSLVATGISIIDEDISKIEEEDDDDLYHSPSEYIRAATPPPEDRPPLTPAGVASAIDDDDDEDLFFGSPPPHELSARARFCTTTFDTIEEEKVEEEEVPGLSTSPSDSIYPVVLPQPTPRTASRASHIPPHHGMSDASFERNKRFWRVRQLVWKAHEQLLRRTQNDPHACGPTLPPSPIPCATPLPPSSPVPQTLRLPPSSSPPPYSPLHSPTSSAFLPPGLAHAPPPWMTSPPPSPGVYAPMRIPFHAHPRTLPRIGSVHLERKSEKADPGTLPLHTMRKQLFVEDMRRYLVSRSPRDSGMPVAHPENEKVVVDKDEDGDTVMKDAFARMDVDVKPYAVKADATPCATNAPVDGAKKKASARPRRPVVHHLVTAPVHVRRPQFFFASDDDEDDYVMHDASDAYVYDGPEVPAYSQWPGTQRVVGYFS